MDRGAWPFFVDGVTCLVISVSVCKEKREERREKMKEKMTRDGGEKCFFFEKCLRTLKPPDESAQNVSKKIPVGRIIPPFFCKSSESDRFFQFFT